MTLEELDRAFAQMMERFPEKRQKLMSNAAEKMYQKVLSNIDKADFKKSSGNLRRGVTKQVGSGGGYAAVRPDWGEAPHTGLIENGHRLVKGKGRGQKLIGWVPGKHMYRNALNELADELEQDGQRTLEELVGEAFD